MKARNIDRDSMQEIMNLKIKEIAKLGALMKIKSQQRKKQYSQFRQKPMERENLDRWVQNQEGGLDSLANLMRKKEEEITVLADHIGARNRDLDSLGREMSRKRVLKNNQEELSNLNLLLADRKISNLNRNFRTPIPPIPVKPSKRIQGDNPPSEPVPAPNPLPPSMPYPSLIPETDIEIIPNIPPIGLKDSTHTKRLNKELGKMNKFIKKKVAKINAQRWFSQIDSEKFKKEIQESVKASMDLEKLIKFDEIKKEMAAAQNYTGDEQRLLNSDEIKREIESARDYAGDAQILINSDEIKREIEAARNMPQRQRGIP